MGSVSVLCAGTMICRAWYFAGRAWYVDCIRVSTVRVVMYVVGLCNRILGIPKIDHHSNARARAYSTEKGGEAAASLAALAVTPDATGG